MTVTSPCVTSRAEVERLLHQWRHYVLQLAARIAKWTGMDIDDARSEIVLYVLRYGRKYDPERGSFSTYLSRSVAKHVRCRYLEYQREQVRTLQVEPRGSRSDDDLDVLTLIPDRAPEPAEQIDRDVIVRRVREAIAALSPDEQHAIRTHYLGEPCRGRVQVRDTDSAIERLREALADLEPIHTGAST